MNITLKDLTEDQVRNFWNKSTQDSNGCWNTSDAGRKIYTENQNTTRIRPHWLAYIIYNGSIPGFAKYIQQTCYNNKCVNPSHLIARKNKLSPSKKNYVGMKSGLLTIIKEAAPVERIRTRKTDAGTIYQYKEFKTMVLCKCECGNERIMRAGNFMRFTSCGCQRIKNITKHGHSTKKNGKRLSEYLAWGGIKSRCYNVNDPGYKKYGGRGIKICDRWKNSFLNFYEDMGQKPTAKHSLDRADVNGDYEPKNCRWSTPGIQTRNRRVTKYLSFNNKTMCQTDWSIELRVSLPVFTNRLKKYNGNLEAVIKNEFPDYLNYG